MINCVKRWRQFEDITQTELAQLSGLSRMAITKIEEGKTIPHLDSALRIAQALNRPVDTLFSIEDEPPETFRWVRPGIIREA